MYDTQTVLKDGHVYHIDEGAPRDTLENVELESVQKELKELKKKQKENPYVKKGYPKKHGRHDFKPRKERGLYGSPRGRGHGRGRGDRGLSGK